MSWAYKRGAKWYAGYRDRRGRRRARVLRGVETKTEARRLAREIEAKEERYRLGLDRPLTDNEWTVLDLLEWWLKCYSSRSRSYATDDATIRKHFPGTALAQLRIDDPDLAGHATRFLHEAHAGGLSKKTANNLRGYLHVAFSRAIEEGRYRALNPVSAVPKMKLPRRKRGSALAPDVARKLIDEGFLPPWRNLAATALYLGLRKGELFALRRSSIDLDGRRLLVRASHEFDTTKGGHDDWLPIPDALVPYLRDALTCGCQTPTAAKLRTAARVGWCEASGAELGVMPVS